MTNNQMEYQSEVSLLALWDAIFRQRWVVICITAFFCFASIVIALLLTPIYRSDVVAAPAQSSESRGILDQFSGLASLAGVQLHNGGETASHITILRSKAFAASFIKDHDLLRVFFDDLWDSAKNQWNLDDPERQPTLFDAIKYFREKVFSVQQDPATGIVTMAVEWRDPEQAAQWVNELVARVNRVTRDRALNEANRNLKYLRGQLKETNVVELQLAISRLIEAEMKSAMFAMANEEYAFKVLDPGIVPTTRVRPHRTLIVLLSTFFGGLLAIITALILDNVQRQLALRKSA